ncbi:hypothetical protein [Flavobacterium phragmitis]|uniref:Uncharacterized protein n=1 Tax=Flavobacterium phragmitis TaxID=739143 RepID=A0A1I1K2V5_9FLAO|nr:hypothetical protein [Flavobacterium phragmitis]SFC55184.1 hypothetical protein SAMN05216297_101228 [Flavobacterium phragmitis]
MQTVLSEIRNLITTSVGRNEVQQRTMHPTITPLTSTPWDWVEYYKYLSLKGLEEAKSFKKDFPKDSDELYFLSNYIIGGKTWLK